MGHTWVEYLQNIYVMTDLKQACEIYGVFPSIIHIYTVYILLDISSFHYTENTSLHLLL